MNSVAQSTRRRARVPRRMGLLEWLGLALVVVLVAVATALAWPVYATPRLWLVSGVGTAVGAGVAAAGWRRGWSVTARVLLIAGLYVVVVGPVAVPAASRSVRGALDGVVTGTAGALVGWRQLLSLRLPVEEYQAVLVPFFAAVVVATAIGTTVALRSDSRAAWAVLPLGALCLVGPAFGPVEPGETVRLGPWDVPDASTDLLAAAAVAAAVAWLGLRDRVRRLRALRLATANVSGSGVPVRRAARAMGQAVLGVLVAAVALTGAVAGSGAASAVADRHVLREGIEPLLAVQHRSAPLDAYRSYFTDESLNSPLFRVEASDPEVDRLVLAVLDVYDGARFTVSARTGTFVRLPRATDEAGTRVSVAVEEWSQIWVPVPEDLQRTPRFGGPRADQLAAAFYLSDAGAGVQVASQGLDASGAPLVGLRTGDSYEVWVTANKVPDLAAPSTPVDLAEQHPELVAWVAAQDQPRTAQGFFALAEALRARGYLSHGLTGGDAWVAALRDRGGYEFQPSYAGHSRARIEELFAALNDQQDAMGPGASNDELIAAIGDDEQFAPAVALVARHLGYESRVVLGVRLSGDETGVPSCEKTCTGQNVAAWVQVRAPGDAWVTVDVDPQHEVPPSPADPGQQLPQQPTDVDSVELPSVDPPEVALQGDVTADDQQEDLDDEEAAAWAVVLRRVGLGLAAVGLILAPLGVVPGAKVVRRRRRRRASEPEVAMVGAWAEAEDRYLDLGVPLVGATRRGAATAVGRQTLVELAELADRAVFGPFAPKDVEAAEAWRLVDDEVAHVSSGASPWGRFRAALSLRSLVRAARGASRVSTVPKTGEAP